MFGLNEDSMLFHYPKTGLRAEKTSGPIPELGGKGAVFFQEKDGWFLFNDIKSM